MADYPYRMQLVVDPDNPRNIVAAGSVSIYDSEDTAHTTLLPLTDPSGVPIPNPITSNANGFTPPFVTTSPEVLWVSGPYTDYFQSYKGMRDEAVAAVAAAEAAAATAGTEAAAVAQAAIGTATDAATAAAGSAATSEANAAASATAAANAAALVGAPADTAMATVVNNTSSAFRGALNATYATEVSTPGKPARTALDALYAGRRDYGISAREFGVLGNGADETVKLQTFVDYLADNAADGFLPKGEYLISTPLNVKNKRGWKLRGASKFGTSIKQTTDNVPVINMGVGGEASGASGFRDWTVSDLMLTYSNVQPAANTNANCLNFVGMGYEAELRDIYFQRGYYGIKVATGQVAPWGTKWDGLHFGPSLTGGALDWSGTVNAVPNNTFGRVFVEANTMVGPLFNIRGYNCVFGAVEVINGSLGPRLLELNSGSRVTFGAFKLEMGSYLATQNLFNIQTSAYAYFGQVSIGGGDFTVNPTSGNVNIFGIGSGGGFASVDIGSFDAGTAGAGSILNGYLFSGDESNRVRIRGKLNFTNSWLMTSHGSGSTINQNIVVDEWVNGIASRSNLGDANLTVSTGQPQTQFFETPFTAQRTVTLPSTASNLTGTLSYSFVLKGAVNGANSLKFVSGSRTIYTHTDTANCTITLRWRRLTAGQDGWYVSSIAPLP